MDPQTRLAVLIDADNAQPSLAGALLAEIAKYGTATVKRAYGDWTLPNLGGWKKTLAEHAIQPIQQFRNTVGKNASDSALIIDAMDLLYTGKLDGFCIVSSDSDFTRLASRIRETGLVVYGFGERKTPLPFVSACDRFVYVDVLRVDKSATPKPAAKTVATATPVQKTKAPSKKVEVDSKPANAAAERAAHLAQLAPGKSDPYSDTGLHRLLREALEDAADDDGWAGLGALGSLVAKRAPNFDSRNYGFRKLSDLLAKLDLFELETRGKSIYLRERPRG